MNHLCSISDAVDLIFSFFIIWINPATPVYSSSKYFPITNHASPYHNKTERRNDRFTLGFILKQLPGRSLSNCGWLDLALLSPQTGTWPLDDGAHWAAAAGVGTVRQLFRLRDCHRCIRHHCPGDFNTKLYMGFFYLQPLPGRLFQRVCVFGGESSPKRITSKCYKSASWSESYRLSTTSRVFCHCTHHKSFIWSICFLVSVIVKSRASLEKVML